MHCPRHQEVQAKLQQKSDMLEVAPLQEVPEAAFAGAGALSMAESTLEPFRISHRRCAVRLTSEIWLPEASWQRYFSMCRASYQWVTCWSTMFAQFHRLENTLRCESLTCSTWWMKIHPKSTLSVTFQQSLSGIRLKRYGDGSKPWYLVNTKIAGKWMFIPLKMYL